MTSLPPQPLSPLDGRYRSAVGELGEHLSEAGLNRARVQVEVEWLIAQTDRHFFGSSPLTAEQKAQLRSVVTEFGQVDIDELAALEATTRHAVKAVEYYARRRLELLDLDAISELTHFACTSEDINNLSYAITVRDAVQHVWRPKFRGLIDAIAALAVEYRDAAMLSRTHGQPATPTTMGKELAVFVHRLERIAKQLRRYKRRLTDHHKGRTVEEPILASQYIMAPESEEEELPPEGQPAIIAELPTEIITLSVSEAVMRMDLADAPALMFRNRAHGGLNVVYRRPDGNIGWIDPANTQKA